MFKQTLMAATAVAMMATSQGQAATYMVPLTREGPSYSLMAQINGVPLQMVLDTGADNICLPTERFAEMTRKGLASPSDLGEPATMGTASGASEVRRALLREVTVWGINGHWRITNVQALIGCDMPLLGQNYLRSVESYSIDNARNLLMLNTPASYTPSPVFASPAPSYVPAPSYTPAPAPAATYDPALQRFINGQRDRHAWESWFTGLTGAYKQGAEYWANVRSTKEAALGCNPPLGTYTVGYTDWIDGCQEAKRLLSVVDSARLDADYKAGWNSIPG
jgi:hypothetical protein